MDVQAITAVVPWSGALKRRPEDAPRGHASEHRARGEPPPVLEGELLSATGGRSVAERSLHADWVQRRGHADTRSVTRALATYAGVAEAGQRPSALVDLYV